MPRGRREGLLIAGGGIAGCLAALAMARFRPDIELMIVEERDRFGGDLHQLLFDDEVTDEARPLLAPIVEQHWPGYFVAFPGFSRKLKAPCAGFGVEGVHRAMLAALRPDQFRLGVRIVAVRDDALVLDDGETIKAEGAIDARGAANLSMLELLHETRVERSIRTARPHGVDRPVLIDATIPFGGARFVQLVPLAHDRLLLSETTISERVQADADAGARLEAYAALRGWADATADAARSVTRPLPFDGDFAAFWRIGGARVAKLGQRGGFVHPLTGRTLADAAAIAMLLTRQTDFSGPVLHDLIEEEAKRRWRQREPLRAVVRTLAEAEPAARAEMLAKLFRLDAGQLGRLLADRLGMLDRGRILRALREV